MFRVAAAAVQVNVGGRVHLAHRGEAVPEGVSEDTLKVLAAKGLIEKVSKKTAPKEKDSGSETGKAEEIDEGAYKGVSVKDLKVVIDERNAAREDAAKIVPAEPGNRPEIVAALLADDAKQ